MSIKLYDDALIEKLRYWTKDTNIKITAPNETQRMFQSIADRKNDSQIELPLVSLSRTAGFTISNTNRRPISYDGIMTKATYEKSISINAIPVTIPYQLDIYTRYLYEADEYARNFIFSIINTPKLMINVPYMDEHFEHMATLRIGEEVADNSDNAGRIVPGQITRLTLSLNIDDAYLWDIRERDNIHVVPYVKQE